MLLFFVVSYLNGVRDLHLLLHVLAVFYHECEDDRGIRFSAQFLGTDRERAGFLQTALSRTRRKRSFGNIQFRIRLKARSVYVYGRD